MHDKTVDFGRRIRCNEARMLSDAADEIERLREHIYAVKALAAKQAEDAGLWFNARTVTEAYLQGALRDLAAIVEEPNKRSLERESHRSQRNRQGKRRL